MSEFRSLVVDVARLSDAPEGCMDDLCIAIEALSRHVGTIALGSVGGVYDFGAEKPLSSRCAEYIHWRRRTADIHAIVTMQDLPRGSAALSPLGLAWIKPSDYVLGDRHTLMASRGPTTTRIATVHEIVHTIRGEQGDSWHCDDKDCTMYESLSPGAIDHYRETNDPVHLCDGCLAKTKLGAIILLNAKRRAANPSHSHAMPISNEACSEKAT